MADLSDVEDALVALIGATLYPSGTAGNPPSPVAGVPVIVYAGWPVPATLDADLAAGKCHVSVYSRPEEQDTSRYMLQWQPQTAAVTTLTLTVSGQQVTVGGTASTPQNVGMLLGKGVAPVVYGVQAADTLSSIAAALAALVPGASAAGAVITLPNTVELLVARVGGVGTSVMEIGRQEKLFQVVVWADSPVHRKAVGAPVNVALRGTEFLTLADQTAGRLIYKRTLDSDAAQKQRLYRRDLFYTVEYGTTVTQQAPQIVATQTNVDVDASGAGNYQTVATVYD